MAFPYHDRFWTETADFVKQYYQDQDQILAPDQFWLIFGKIYRYYNTYEQPNYDYQWAIIHKGELPHLCSTFLQQLPYRMSPVFANDVFIVWSSYRHLIPLGLKSNHVEAMFAKIAELPPSFTYNNPLDDHILPYRTHLEFFGNLNDQDFQESMDNFWKNGGYVAKTLRDSRYYQELDRYLQKLIGDGENQVILDVCCGNGKFLHLLKKAQKLVGIDIAPTAVNLAKNTYQSYNNFEFQVMDAHHLNFENETFNIVLLIDSIEHTKNPEKVIQEINRVTKTQGQFLLTVANNNSIHRIMNRKLGYPEFLTNYQHIREFVFSEIEALLLQNNFKIEQTGGVFLYPYWGVAGVDDAVRELNDNDPEIVEIMRQLGDKIGADYAYVFVILATKTA